MLNLFSTGIPFYISVLCNVNVCLTLLVTAPLYAHADVLACMEQLFLSGLQHSDAATQEEPGQGSGLISVEGGEIPRWF